MLTVNVVPARDYRRHISSLFCPLLGCPGQILHPLQSFINGQEGREIMRAVPDGSSITVSLHREPRQHMPRRIEQISLYPLKFRIIRDPYDVKY
jgi:hypothetical protein